ncbi:MAG: bifunctional glutamate N-acetyltransferase/amino-acid acetyltransferase ArgJ [Akkermansia sp.]
MDISELKTVKGGVCAPQGFLGNALSCGIKKPTATRLDLALIYSSQPCVSSGAFTTNRVKAACVKVSQAHLNRANLRAIVANSGNANACTGVEGVMIARKECKIIAKQLGLTSSEIGVCSTGVIGLPMPMVRIEPRLPELAKGLAPDQGELVSQAIITSDTTTKEVSVEFEIDGKPVRIGACCKGAGMISPCMATMLCFITTDVGISRELLDKYTQDAVEHSFNRITIDGDMSTNDTVLILANGASGVTISTGSNALLFRDALMAVMLLMAKHVVQDGERVTKFVTVRVSGSRSYSEAKKVAEAVAKSSLVKSSWNGNDPNWGRIIHAVGYSRARVREELIDIDIAGLPACRGGMQADTPSDQLREAVQVRDFTIAINLNQGDADYTVYTTDLSPEYVDFNRSEYAYWNQAKVDGLTK